MTVTYRVGVDIGGTFTDIVLLGSDGTVHTKKISSSVGNYAQAIVDGLSEVFRESGLDGSVLEEIRHGTTVASNAILEHKGARVGLITTKGFRDSLEMGREIRYDLYDLFLENPPTLVPRYLRFEVDGRMAPDGEELQRFDEQGFREVAKKLVEVCPVNIFGTDAGGAPELGSVAGGG